MRNPRVFGRYEVIDLIGEGGMGALYRARDPLIGRYVAIKVLQAAYNTPELRDRFSREARAAGCLSHPNIVTIYDVGEQDGLPFIAMEYVRGETFADLIGLTPPLPLARKLQLVEEVCAGLAHAHEAGIVHRDIKPANLIVGAEGTVKILDFGIAKVVASGLTSPGTVLGTLNYMAPEQVRGTPVDARADIFALGAVLYELVSHQPAFTGKIPTDVLRQILGGVAQPITDLCPGLDPRLVQVIEKALEKEPDRRFQSVVEMQRAVAVVRQQASRADGGRGADIPRPPDQAPPVSISRARTPPPPPVPEDPGRRRREALESHLDAARQAFAARDYDAALAWCRRALLLDASDERTLTQMAEAQRALDDQRLQQLLLEARTQLQAGAFASALHALDAAAVLSPSNAAVKALHDQVLREQERARAAVVQAGLGRARAEYERDNPDSAIREADRVLALDPGNLEAQTLKAAAAAVVTRRQQDARTRAAVASARHSFARGEHQAALKQLESLDPGANPVVAQALDELRQAWIAIEERRRIEQEEAERQRRVASLLSKARDAIQGDRLDDAGTLVDEIRALAPDHSELPAVAARLEEAEAARQLRARLASLLEAFSASVSRGDLDAAGGRLRDASALSPADPRVQAAAHDLEKARTEQAAREAAEARQRDGEEKLEVAHARLDAGDLEGAAAALADAAALVPQHPRAADLSGRLQEAMRQRAAEEEAERRRHKVAELLATASQPLHDPAADTSALLAAVRQVKEALSLQPENEEATSLKTSLEAELTARREAARARTVVENARRRFANGKHQAAIRLLEEAQPSSHPEIVAALAELRAALQQIEAQRQAERERLEREQRLAAVVAEARAALEQQQIEKAKSLAAAASEVDPASPSVSALADAIREAEAAAERRARLEQALTSIETVLSQGDLSTARDLLQAAAALAADDPRLAAIRQRVDTAVAERNAAEARARDRDAALAAAESCFEGGDLDAAREQVRLAAGLDAEHAKTIDLAGRIDRAIDERQLAAQAAQRRRTVDDLLDGAMRLLESGDHFDPARAKRNVAEALALLPGEPRALTLKVAVENALDAKRESARVEAAIRNARSRFANGKHQAALHLLEQFDASNPSVAAALTEMRAVLASIEEQRRTGGGPSAGAADTPAPHAPAAHAESAALSSAATVVIPAAVVAAAAGVREVTSPAAPANESRLRQAAAGTSPRAEDLTVLLPRPPRAEPAAAPPRSWRLAALAIGLVVLVLVVVVLLVF